jgi:hypothetical protein
MFFVKPRLKHSIERKKGFEFREKNEFGFFVLKETLKKKRDLENKDEKPQLTKTEGRFETYTGKYYLSMNIK